MKKLCYAVVLLVKSRKKIVIPEGWIKDLTGAKLKNYGVNANQKFLIFWSNDKVSGAVTGEGIPNLAFEPNFSAPLREAFDIDIVACYISNVIKYFGKQKTFL